MRRGYFRFQGHYCFHTGEHFVSFSIFFAASAEFSSSSRLRSLHAAFLKISLRRVSSQPAAFIFAFFLRQLSPVLVSLSAAMFAAESAGAALRRRLADYRCLMIIDY